MLTRRLPIQCSVDVAAPIDVVWDEWNELEFLPEDPEEIDVLDERIDESFAWHSNGRSDYSGLATFHELSDRLTRVEVHLDVIPGSVKETVAYLTHVADLRAQVELKRFKAHVESIDPDDYPPPEQ